MRDTLFLIDTMSQVYRAFYALKNLTSPSGFPTGAIFGFAGMLRKILSERRPVHMAAAMEGKGPVFRKERYAEYKAHRKPTPDDLKPQIPVILDIVRAYGIQVISLDGYEADDVIARLTIDAHSAGADVVVISSDKDLFQLVTDGVTVVDARADVVYDEAKVFEKLGVRPCQVLDYLALVGDDSDNIPGAPGIGPKTASGLLAAFGTLDSCLDRIDEIEKPRIREIIRENRGLILASRELARAAPGPVPSYPLDSLLVGEPDVAALREIFDRCHFRSFLKDLSGDDPARPTLFQDAPREPAPATAAPAAGERVSKALVFGGSGVYYMQGSGGAAPVSYVLPADAAKLAEEARSVENLRTARLKEVCRTLDLRQEDVARADDVSIMHYLLHPERAGHSLQEAHLEAGGVELPPDPWESAEKNLLSGEPEPPAVASMRGAAVHRCAGYFTPILHERGLYSLYRDVEIPLSAVLASMEKAGILVDLPWLAGLSARLGERLAGLEQEIYRAAGERFNIQSPKQLGYILYEKWGMPSQGKTKKTKSPSTGVDALEALSESHELPRLVLGYRHLAKLKSTYADSLPRLADPATGRVHTTFQQTVAATGRLSSVNPNIQNIPVRTPEGREIRRAFIAPPGSVLISADYSQIELRIMAHMSRDPGLTAAFKSDVDIHKKTAVDLFGALYETDPSEFRRRAKAVNFGLLYGQTDYGLAKELKIAKSDARSVIDAYFRAYPGVGDWIRDNLRQARDGGFVRTLFGRIRPSAESSYSTRVARDAGDRVATNAPVQGTASDIIKIAMVRLDRRLRSSGSSARPLLQVHDELVVECPENELEATAATVKETMESAAALDVPLKVDIHWGANWLDAKK